MGRRHWSQGRVVSPASRLIGRCHLASSLWRPYDNRLGLDHRAMIRRRWWTSSHGSAEIELIPQI